MNKTEIRLQKIFYLCLKIHYYYYFILAIINLILFYFKVYNILNITTILVIVSLLIELMRGYIRGYFGKLGYIIAIGVSIYFVGDIWRGISVGISIVSIINIIIGRLVGKVLSFLIMKFH